MFKHLAMCYTCLCACKYIYICMYVCIHVYICMYVMTYIQFIFEAQLAFKCSNTLRVVFKHLI